MKSLDKIMPEIDETLNDLIEANLKLIRQREIQIQNLKEAEETINRLFASKASLKKKKQKK